MTLDELRTRHADLLEERNQILDDMQAILDAVGPQDRIPERDWKRFTDLEQKELRIRNQIQALGARAKAWGEALGGQVEAGSDARPDLDRDPIADPFDTTPARHRGGDPWDIVRGAGFARAMVPATELRARALSAAERMPGASDAARERLTRVLERQDDAAGTLARQTLLTSAPAYVSAFARLVRGDNILTAPEAAAVRAVQEFRAFSLTDAAGGFLVPIQIDPVLYLDDNGKLNPVREIAAKKIATSSTLRVVTSTAATASWDAEAAEVSDDSTTIGEKEIEIHTMRVFLPYSFEIGMDAAGNWTAELTKLMVEAKNQLEATAFITGSGTGQPRGIVTALQGGASEITSNTTDVFALSDVYDVHEELPAKYRKSANCGWLANMKTYTAIREAGGANLDDFWVPLIDPVPPKLLGLPAYESDQVDGVIDADADNRVLMLVDWNSYVIADRIGFAIEPVPHLFGANHRPTGQRGLFGWARLGADLVSIKAGRLLNVT